MNDDLKALNREVTAAIGRARDTDGGPGSAAAHLLVSQIEERIARITDASTPEGVIARRGAVMAAVAAMDFRRAEELAEEFGPGMDEEQRRQLRTLVPRVVASEVIDASLRRILDESRGSCVAARPCAALGQVADEIAEAVPRTRQGLVVLASNLDDVPESWAENGSPTVLTFEEYATRLADLAQLDKTGCQPECLALPAARTRLRAWVDELRGDSDLVVIKPGG